MRNTHFSAWHHLGVRILQVRFIAQSTGWHWEGEGAPMTGMGKPPGISPAEGHVVSHRPLGDSSGRLLSILVTSAPGCSWKNWKSERISPPPPLLLWLIDMAEEGGGREQRRQSGVGISQWNLGKEKERKETEKVGRTLKLPHTGLYREGGRKLVGLTRCFNMGSPTARPWSGTAAS